MSRPDGVEYPEFNWIRALLFFGYIGAFFLQVGSRVDFFATIRLEFLLAAILLGMALIYDPKMKYPESKIRGLLVFYLLTVVIQVPLSVDFDHSYKVFIDRFLKFSVMAIFIARFVNHPKMVVVFLAAFLLSCFKMGQEGLVGNITGSMMWENQGVMRLHGTTRLYAHPNSFAGMALGTLPFLYYLYPISGKYLRIFYLIMLAFAVNIIIFSGSRTGYVGFFGMVLLVFWNSHHKRRFITLGLICIVVGAFFMPQQYVERFESIFTGKEKEGRSTETRVEVLVDAIEVFGRNPLGVGVAAFPVVRQEYYGRRQDTHNLYLEVATNLGVQGLIAFLLLFGAVIKGYGLLRHSFADQLASMRKLLPDKGGGEEADPSEEHTQHLQLYLAMTNAVLTYLVIRLVLGLFGHDLYEIYWWIVLGFLVALNRLNAVAQKRTRHYCGEARVQSEPW